MKSEKGPIVPFSIYVTPNQSLAVDQEKLEGEMKSE